MTEVLVGILVALPALVVGIYYLTRPEEEKRRSGQVLTVTSSIMLLGGLIWGLLSSVAVTSVPDFTPDFGGPPATSATATYRVTGTSSAMITYDKGDGGTEQVTVSLPWSSAPISLRGGEMLSVSAQAQSYGASVTVSILINGQEWKTATSSGDFCIAMTNGWWGME